MIFIQDRPLSQEHNDFSALLHELAHIRLDLFIEANLASIARKMPEHLMRRAADGGYELDEQLFSYIHERYAHETELAVLRATYPRYYAELPEQWGLVFDLSQEASSKIISDFVVSAYGVKDPQFWFLRDRSNGDILRRGIPDQQKR